MHPGPPGDRGPAALDWAILRGVERWGVTVLQADAAMDAGAVWASEEFAMRLARKGSLYRNEVTDSAVSAVRRALRRFEAGERPAQPPAGPRGWQPALRQMQRAIDWQRDDTATVLRKTECRRWLLRESRTCCWESVSGCSTLIVRSPLPAVPAP